MTDSPRNSDRDSLPSDVADRLLARAAELDLRQGAGAEIASLRAAAVEAGIRPEAFDAALAEMRASRPHPVGLAAIALRGRGAGSRKIAVALGLSIIALIVGSLLLRLMT